MGGVLHVLNRTVVTKRELRRKAKVLIYQSIFAPTLTYGHEQWVMTKRKRSRVQVAEMGFLRRVAGVSFKDRVRSSAIREGIGVEPQLLCVERSQLRWFGHLIGCHQGAFLGRCSLARPTGRRHRDRGRTRWRDYISSLSWEHLGIPQSVLADVAGESEVWGSLLKLLPPRPDSA